MELSDTLVNVVKRLAIEHETQEYFISNDLLSAPIELKLDALSAMLEQIVFSQNNKTLSLFSSVHWTDSDKKFCYAVLSKLEKTFGSNWPREVELVVNQIRKARDDSIYV